MLKMPDSLLVTLGHHLHVTKAEKKDSSPITLEAHLTVDQLTSRPDRLFDHGIAGCDGLLLGEQSSLANRK